MAATQPVDDSFLDEQDDSFLDDVVDDGWRGPSDAVGPSSEGVDPAALRPRQSMNTPLAMIEGTADAIPGTAFVGAALDAGKAAVGEFTTAMAGGVPSSRRVLEAWNESRARQLDRSQHARQSNPLGYVAGNIPGAIGTAFATGGTALAARFPQLAAIIQNAPRGTSAATAALESAAQRQNAGELSGGGVATDVAIGAAAPQVFSAIAQPVKAVADKLQIGQRVTDAVANVVGGTKLGQKLGGVAEEPGAIASARVRGLVGDINAKPVQTPETYTPIRESAQADLDWLRQNAPRAAPDENMAFRLAEANRRTSPSGRDAELGSNWSADAKEFGDDFFRLQSEARDEAANRYASGYSDKQDPILWMQKEAETLALEGNEVGAGSVFDQINDYKGAAKEGFNERVSGVMDRAQDLKGKLDELEEAASRAWGNKMEQERIAAVAEQAAGELNRIQTGRQAMQNAAGLIGGATVGAKLGPAGMLMGAAAGKNAGKPIFGAVDAAGALGQRMETLAIPNITDMAKKWAARPFGDPLGNAARWALEGKGEAAMVRMMALAKLPEAQREAATER